MCRFGGVIRSLGMTVTVQGLSCPASLRSVWLEVEPVAQRAVVICHLMCWVPAYSQMKSSTAVNLP